MYNENSCDDDSPLARELYAFRKLYNAALFNEWHIQQIFNVHKSKRHHDGEPCFGGDMFIVSAMLPTGLISQHYYLEDWNLFSIAETEKGIYQYDGHNPQTVLSRLKRFILDAM